MDNYTPPFTITNKMLNSCISISKKIVSIDYSTLDRMPRLRRNKLITSINASLAIEDDCGKFRNHGEAVYDGDIPIFVAPPHTMVPELMNNLFNWMNNAKEEVNPLILSFIFHYEFVFIHPFSDGNGRTARLWQTAILAHWKDLFKYIPIESIIRKHQEEYYTAIQNCNNVGESTEFIERVGSTKNGVWRILKYKLTE